jgi:hypothetical protein
LTAASVVDTHTRGWRMCSWMAASFATAKLHFPQGRPSKRREAARRDAQDRPGFSSIAAILKKQPTRVDNEASQPASQPAPDLAIERYDFTSYQQPSIRRFVPSNDLSDLPFLFWWPRFPMYPLPKFPEIAAKFSRDRGRYQSHNIPPHHRHVIMRGEKRSKLFLDEDATHGNSKRATRRVQIGRC